MTVPMFRRATLRLVSFILVLAITGAGCTDDEQPASFPPIDTGGDGGMADTLPEDATRLDLPGLSAPVVVRFDQWGVLHVECQKLSDCIAAQGYYHADDRFFEMDLIRRQTRGRLSSLVGVNFAFSFDRRFRHLMSTREGEPLAEAYLKNMDEQTRRMLRAYTSGVNAWLEDMRNDTNGATLTEEYESPLLSDDIPDWKPVDSIALYLQLAYQLSLTSDGDLFRADMIDALGATVAGDLFTTKPGPVSNIMQAAGVQMTMSRPPSGNADRIDSLRQIRRRLAPASEAIDSARSAIEGAPSLLFGPRSPRDGSNNWVVSAGQTADGKALLANDPHLTLNTPPIWYYNELHVTGTADGLHVAGASIPSTPGVVVGQNEHIAWGVTTARLDLADAYVETLNKDGTAVMRDGNEVSLITREVTIEGSGGSTKTATLEWVPDHGPLISKDTKNNRGISIKWVAQSPGKDFNFLLPMMRAESVQEAIDAMSPVETINQSWVFADDSGSVAWYPRGAIPKRPWVSKKTPNWLPLPGDGSAEWKGTIAEKDAPRVVEPPKGYLATANNDFDGSYTDGDATDDGHLPWQSPPAPGYRHKRIIQQLSEKAGDHSVETMHDVQSDTRSLHGAALVPEIVEAADKASSLSSRARKVLSALKNWDYTCPTGLQGTDPEKAKRASDSEATEAIGCSAFHVLLPHLTDAVFGDELEAADSIDAKSNWDRLQVALRYVFLNPSELARGSDYIDDTSTSMKTETEAEIVAGALDAAAGELESLFGSPKPSKWLWGRTHTLTLRSLFAQAGLDMWDEGPYANDGGLSTVDVANPTGKSFGHNHGPSLRIVFELGEDDVEGWFQLPGGQDHHRDSKHYLSLLDEWLRNESHELLFEPAEVREAAEQTFVLEPKE